jgi:hypothetical protein
VTAYSFGQLIGLGCWALLIFAIGRDIHRRLSARSVRSGVAASEHAEPVEPRHDASR